jgi:hypothetical protein
VGLNADYSSGTAAQAEAIRAWRDRVIGRSGDPQGGTKRQSDEPSFLLYGMLLDSSPYNISGEEKL